MTIEKPNKKSPEAAHDALKRHQKLLEQEIQQNAYSIDLQTARLKELAKKDGENPEKTDLEKGGE